MLNAETTSPIRGTGSYQSLIVVCALSFSLWTCIALFHVLAVFLDADTQGLTQSKASTLIQYLLIFSPLSLGNCLLALAIWLKPDQMLKPRYMIVSALLLVVFGLPLITANKVMITLLFADKPLSLFLPELKKSSAFILWIDLFLILFSYFLQAGFAAWQRTVARELELITTQNESMELRLQLLQGQLKPHFLFNALNSISALVRGADRQLAGTALKQLNALLRYVLDSSKHEWLSVADELQFVRDYLNMQLLRFGDRMQIVWHIEDRDWHAVPCPPLLMQPSVENAIHHGVETHHEQCRIDIELRVVDRKTIFRIRNAVFASPKANCGHGLGIASTRERLQILYQGQASLVTTQTESEFIAEISIPQSRRFGKLDQAPFAQYCA
ncbi:sensor histidine kinase [Undibacterium flavidum]|uniref:Histidine kinase n=1 Tax=Undibacterium flavidum TaxID=2762297 RepID=A0ABR6YAF9_9BURK|nr:histidine kinase [Undibacterium flavidum]MBC3873628.1 histidine kinase [Undibacterium flavidum]